MAEQTLEASRAQPRAAARTTTTRAWRPNPGQIVLYVVLILLALFFVLPLVWMLSTSLKPGAEVYTDNGWIPQNPSLANFEAILGSSFPVLSWFVTSLLAASLGTAGVIILSSMSGYAFARMDFPGKRVIFGLLIATLLMPPVMLLVPQFLLIVHAGNIVPQIGLGSLPAYMLPHLAAVFGVFFMRQFFLGIPVEIEEAAYVDGASRFTTFRSVVLPLAAPALATLGVITFLAIWNDYLWPLVNCSFDPNTCTLQAGLVNFQGQYSAEYGLLMAGAAIAAVPVLIFYVVAQRFIIQSVASAGVKG